MDASGDDIGSRTSNPGRRPDQDQTTIEAVAALRMVVDPLAGPGFRAPPRTAVQQRKRFYPTLRTDIERNNHGDFTTPFRR
jgi:hypothetical protein